MYIPAWSPLSPRTLVRRTSSPLPYPLGASNVLRYYVARSGIYALFRALRMHGVDAVLVPDYHSGNEVRAIRAAGVRVVFYSIDRYLRLDLDELDRLSGDGRIHAIYLIHYMGWPQPVDEVRSMCERRGMLLIEDCALSLLSSLDSRPLGTFGDYAVFCLYKTLPLPNGGMLVQNGQTLPELRLGPTERCSMASLMGRSAELLLSWIRLRWDSVGAALFDVKKSVGKGLTAARVRRVPVGDMGFEPSSVNLRMSSISDYLLHRLDYDAIVERRRRNFLQLRDRLQGVVTFVREDLEKGVCPLFCPVLVPDKHAAASALQAMRIEAVEFWNYGDAEAACRKRGAARFLRRHLLELPLHQNLSPERIDYIADQVRALFRRAA